MLKIGGTNGNDILDALADTDTITVYDGDVPAHVADPAGGNILISFSLSGYDAASGGLKSLSSLPITSSVNVGGTPTYFRMSHNGTDLMQGTITTAGQGGDMQIGATTLNQGQTIGIKTFQFISFNDDN